MQKAQILVADDSRTIRALLRRTLSNVGYDVTLACDGLEAVQLARRSSPDLAILDIQMPEMNGYVACEQLLAINTIPVIFLTKSEDGHLTALGKDLGAYLPKPVCEQTLLQTVDSLLPQATGTASC